MIDRRSFVRIGGAAAAGAVTASAVRAGAVFADLLHADPYAPRRAPIS